MNIVLESNRLQLQRHQLLRVEDAFGARVVCLHGELWVTQPGDLDDHFMREGDILVLDRTGPTLVSAEANSLVRLDVRRRLPWWSWHRVVDVTARRLRALRGGPLVRLQGYGASS